MKIAVNSGLIEHVCYDEQAAHLQVQLRDGSRREFAPVPRAVVENLVTAPSPGTFYIENIRRGFPRLSETSVPYPRSTRWLFEY